MKYSTAFLLLLIPALAAALTPEQRGLEIAREMDRRDSGFGDQMADLTMVLKNRHGDQTTRKVRNKTLEVKDDGDKSLVIFDSPADVKGTAFLSFTHAVQADDQWLYLPALKRVKRISSSNKSGPFMGSEFAYEDISSQEVEKYTYKFVEDSDMMGRKTLLMERYPAYKKSGYSKQRVWVDKQYYQPLKVEFFDRRGSLMKTLTYHDYRQYLDKYWRPAIMEMVNHQTGKSTRLSWDNYRFKTGLNGGDFDRNALKRVR